MSLRLGTASKTFLRHFSILRRGPPTSQIWLKRPPVPLGLAQLKLFDAYPVASFSTSNFLRSSSKNDDDNENDKKSLSELADEEAEEAAAKEETTAGPTTTIVDIPAQIGTPASGVPMTPQVPENWPIVPIIAINKHPVFPKFIKIIEVSDERLVHLLRRNIKVQTPYAGVFVKKSDDNMAEVVKDPDELYPIGSFVQIVEMQDLGNRLRMVVMAHRRISMQNAGT